MDQSNIGIITFQESNNFGAMYQAYGLQKFIQQQGYNAEIIDYHSREKESQYSTRFSKHRSLLQNINIMLSKPLYSISRKKFDAFRGKFLNITPARYTHDNISVTNALYSAFVCGSDQVWNPENIKGDLTYYLNFVDSPIRRISYAPSVGIEKIDEKDISDFVTGIIGFPHISAREQSAVELIYKMTGKEAVLTADPTLLLDDQQWTSMLTGSVSKKPYILLYNLDYTPRMVSFAKKASRTTGLPVLLPVRTVRDFKDGFKPRIWGPEEFLNAVYGAEYVITNAYHGLLMSVIFEKEVIVFDKKKMKNGTGGRLNDFLSIAGMTDRKGDEDIEILNRSVDYDSVKHHLLPYRERSRRYLIDSLTKAIEASNGD